ncbi:MAG: DNA-directed RNA polymerase subunit beta' [Gammaproteobacteria bacterium]|nr:DNA-directed RNA polymerase subunit beta' [Gammaproteobacteria bacterium]
MDNIKQYSLHSKKRDLESISISLASPETIRSWSFGEVKRPETINYRTLKPETEGLFCAKIFGPVKDYECLCGKYKKLKHRGVICEKCGVEVMASKVRRSRMGHIELASPVAHIWFLKSLPSRLGLFLDIPVREMEKIIYFQSNVVIEPGNSGLRKGELINYEKSESYKDEVVEDFRFKSGAGAEAILEMIENVDIKETLNELREQIENSKSDNSIKKISKRIKLLEAFNRTTNDPRWMILKVLPILPPELRPLVPLEGGRFATSDLNDGYRRVINRNNRLQRLINLHAPEVIIHNEKRMLQEAVDSLLDNTRGPRSASDHNTRRLKSLVDMIKGKQGRFRQNLLGKRVDYSGRSVIVAGPELRLHECGLPKKMAIELFKPFVFHKLIARDLANTIKSAKRIVENENPVIWDILAEVIHQHPVILNRAPTLHRLGIQAFEPTLIEGKAIQLHPLVCAAYNADFDGDQMGVYVPLSYEAQQEARVLMMSSNNILSPANGAPIIVPSQDVVLGLYYLTRMDEKCSEPTKVYADPDEVSRAHNSGALKLHDKIKVRVKSTSYNKDKELITEQGIYDTTVGRLVFFNIVPDGIEFSLINKTMKHKDISGIISISHKRLELKTTVIFADRLMYLGFEYATKSGISISLDDLKIPIEKKTLIEKAEEEINQIARDFGSGLLTRGEKYNKTIDAWSNTNDEIGKVMMRNISTDIAEGDKGKESKGYKSFNPVYMMADSGARGSESQIRQLAGMRGLMARPDGSIIETAVTSNFREGLSVLQYFICTHGARKGLADTALKTANSGYLTRRLVDVAQDFIVSEEDCGSDQGIRINSVVEGGDTVVSLAERIYGRVAAEDVYSGKEGVDEVVLPIGTYFDDEAMQILDEHNVGDVIIRSPVTCKASYGICRQCYGIDLARGALVNRGEAVGVIAAQSIGEPGTQLTMRTFYTGGTASKASLVDNVTAKLGGTVKFDGISYVKRVDENDLVVISRSGRIKIFNNQNRETENYNVPYGASITIEAGDKVSAGQQIAHWNAHSLPIIAEESGVVNFADFEENITVKHQTDESTGFSNIEIINPTERPPAGKAMRPSIYITDKSGKPVMHPELGRELSYILPAKSVVNVVEGQAISKGTAIARIAIEEQKSHDITGGLPRVAALFEARIPKDSAILAPVKGIVKFGKETADKIKMIILSDEGDKLDEITIPRRRHINVLEGSQVEAGELICEGVMNPHDILKYKGEEELTNYIVNEVQTIYRMQGVKINDKHIEVIVSQLLRKIKIIDVGDSTFVKEEQVDIKEVKKVNDELIKGGQKPTIYERTLLGITSASLATDSFISAASFQDTTRVLTDAAINSKTDILHGLKENVVVGCLIPAGTGYFHYEMMKEKSRRRALMGGDTESTELSADEQDSILENISSDLSDLSSDSIDDKLFEEAEVLETQEK